ncbi:MAG: ATP cone domain-containing protein [bacterium]|nr:ATP cone domain-containing protein [bacterium]
MSTSKIIKGTTIAPLAPIINEKPIKTNVFVKQIQKRDGIIVQFDLNKITNAIHKAMVAGGEGSFDEAEMVANKVLADLVRISKKYKNFLPTVEGIQDSVEKELILSEYVQASKSYILYRNSRAEMRKRGLLVPEHVKELVTKSKKNFHNQYSEFIFYRSYSRWNETEGRRETWFETVDRYFNFMKENLGNKLKDEEYAELREAVLQMKVVPSMRLMWGAGKAARKSNAVAYNCSYIAPTSPRDISEVMYLSMNGVGVGFSAESETAQQFPIVGRQRGKKRKTFIIEDSREGWCEALAHGLETWFAGEDIEFDYSNIRPMGARLMTMGGRASGPGPLMELMEFSRNKILSKQGKRLSNLDVHDVICKVGEMAVAGGVRRTALISLTDLDDEQMRNAKNGQFYITEPQRSLANNSAVYLEKPTATQFMEEWLALAKSHTGERGIFNRGSLQKQMPERRWKKLPEEQYRIMGSNPCGEINLRSKQFCNLTEIIARPEDTEKTLIQKARIATILGTYQATLTNFTYLSPEWKKNCEEERLLGVSITGQWDSTAVRDAKVMSKMRDEVIRVNAQIAKRFKIAQSTAVTCVKPSGTVSQLTNASSGMHPRHSKYFIRRVRISSTDALFQLMKDQGIPFHPEVGQTMENANTFVLEFPIKAPDNATTFKNDLSAIEQLEYWKMVKTSFTEHNPSVTISIGEDEWIEAGNWVYKNWDIIGGLSFLPRSDHAYKMAPYEEIDEKKYNELLKNIPDIDFSKIMLYEHDDKTEGAKELACAGGTCEI